MGSEAGSAHWGTLGRIYVLSLEKKTFYVSGVYVN